MKPPSKFLATNTCANNVQKSGEARDSTFRQQREKVLSHKIDSHTAWLERQQRDSLLSPEQNKYARTAYLMEAASQYKSKLKRPVSSQEREAMNLSLLMFRQGIRDMIDRGEEAARIETYTALENCWLFSNCQCCFFEDIMPRTLPSSDSPSTPRHQGLRDSMLTAQQCSPPFSANVRKGR